MTDWKMYEEWDGYPLTIVADRYNGVSSGAAYTAWPLAAAPAWVSGEPSEAMRGWEQLQICGGGRTPDEAATLLRVLLSSGEPYRSRRYIELEAEKAKATKAAEATKAARATSTAASTATAKTKAKKIVHEPLTPREEQALWAMLDDMQTDHAYREKRILYAFPRIRATIEALRDELESVRDELADRNAEVAVAPMFAADDYARGYTAGLKAAQDNIVELFETMTAPRKE